MLTALYKNKTLLVTVFILGLVGVSYVVPALVSFRETLLIYVQRIWWAILLGLFLGGLIDYYIPQEYISHLLAKKEKKTILRAVLFGSLMSICSCGVLALSMQLYKKGAATSSVVAFLLASPWANLPLTLILIGFFGFLKALYIILSAIVVAVISGLVFQCLEAKGWVERNQNTVATLADYSISSEMRKRRDAYSFSSIQIKKDVKGVIEGIKFLSNTVLWWIFIGMGFASFLGAYVPSHIFQKYMGPTVMGMAVTLAVATVLEVCSEGMSPLAFEIYRQTGALGNSLVFLMAGVATDYTEIGLLWANVGRRTALWLPIIAVPQIIAWGAVANLIFR